MELIAQGAGWRLIEVEPNGSENTMLWEIRRSAIDAVPLTEFQRDIVRQTFAETPIDAPDDIARPDTPHGLVEAPLYFSQEMLQALEDPEFPTGYEHYLLPPDDDELNGLDGGLDSLLSICRWRDRTYSKAWNYSKNLANLNLPFNGTISGGLTANLPITGNIHVTARYKRRECLGIPVGFRFVGANGHGSAGIAGNASLTAAASFSHSWQQEWHVHTIDLGSHSFMVGPVPVRLDFSLPLYVGARFDIAVAGNVSAQLDASANGTFTFNCGTSSCTGTSNFSDQFEFTQPTGSVTLDLGTEAHLRAMVRVALYHDSFLYVEGGAKAYARADVWGYYGNDCGDGNGDGQNETVRALVADLLAGYRFAYGWGGVINNQVRYTGGSQFHLGWYDLLGPGGSTALQPMIHGPATITQGVPASYTIRMRPCYKYSPAVTVAANPGSFTGAAPFAPAAGSTIITGSFTQPGNQPLTVTSLSDAFGRQFNVGNTRMIQVVPSVPNAPSHLSATLAGAAVQLHWVDNSNNETSFDLQRRVIGGSWTGVILTGANVTSYLDSGVAPSTSYQFRVRARNSAGGSAWSSLASTTTPTGMPAAPSNLSASYSAATSRLTATWTDNANNESGFELEFSYSGSPFSPIPGTFGPNTMSWSSGSGVPNGPYQFRVRAYNGQGHSAWSNTAFVLAY